ncbi:MAG: DUF748 domain-containing protein [Candidatus Omnitrophica bacterium]|nr:DUF748 domain-containing protein [Candidatus Omnitrophota bacterium]
MRIILKIILVFFLILILLFVAANLFVAVKGRDLVTEKLSLALGQEVSLGSISLKAPLVLEIKELKIGKIASINYFSASASMIGLLGGKFIFNQVKVIKPQVNLERGLAQFKETNSVEINLKTDKTVAQTKEALAVLPVKHKSASTVLIKHLLIQRGAMHFIDWAIPDSIIQVNLENISLDIENFYLLPKSIISNFQLSAEVPKQGEFSQGSISASGWMDFNKKDMQAVLELKGIDAVAFHAYYSKWVDLENSLINKAILNFFSKIEGKENDITADCRLELTDIEFRPRPPEKQEHKAEKITTAILGIFRSLNQGKVILNFTIKTKMDRPVFRFDSVSSAVDSTISQAIRSKKVKVKDVSSLPGRLFEGVARGAGGVSKAIIDGAVSIGESISDAFLDWLKTEKESEETK